MGLEANCRARCDDQFVAGKLHLDSTALSFSGKGLQWSLDLAPGIKTNLEQGWLIVSRGRKKAAFELGPNATKWQDKILHQPSRAQKLGLKPELVYWMSGNFPADFVQEFAAAGATATKKLSTCQLGFLLLEKQQHLAKLIAAAKQLPPRASLWVVWPKGNSELTQKEVMKCAAECSLGPSKVAAFDQRLTAMRYSKK